MLGILVAHVLPMPWRWVMSGCWGLSVWYLAKPGVRRVLLLPMLIVAGATHATLWNGAWFEHDLRRLLGDAPAEVVIRGELVRDPHIRRSPDPAVTRVILRARVDVTHVQRKGGEWSHACGRVLVRGYGAEPVPTLARDHVRISGVIRPAEPALVPGGYDARSHLRRQRIHYELECHLSEEWAVLERERSRGGLMSWHRGFVDWGRATLARGLPEVDEPVELLWAMLLGWREALKGETGEPFMRSGTMHLFAISGLHVGMIAMAMAGLFRVAGLNRRWSGLLVIPLLWFYAGATGWQPSAVRSTMMMSVVMAGRVLERPDNLANSLSLAAGLILLWDPNQLFHAGFQLSFVVVLTLVLSQPLLDWAYEVTMSPDPFKPSDKRSVKPGRWRRACHYLLNSVILSVAAWLGSLPLVALHFHYFSPISVPANVVLIPMAGLALISGLASLLSGWWWPGLSVLFNHSAWFWMMAMQRLTEWASEVPGGAWHVEGPTLMTLLAYYAVIITGGMLLWARSRLRWGALGAAVLLLMVSVSDQRARRPEFRLTVLAQEGGHTIHIEEAGDFLVDTGDEAMAVRLLHPYLRSRGVNRLEGLVLTHGDKRHVGGAVALTERYSPFATIVSPVGFRSAIYRHVTNYFGGLGKLHRVQAGDVLRGWQVLYPAQGDRVARADDGVLVLYRRVGGVRMLLVGDLGFQGQNALLNRHPELRADVVIAGMPDGGRGLANGFLERVRPGWVVVADSPRPAAERADAGMRARLRGQVRRVDFTSDCGSVTVWRDAQGWQVSLGGRGEGE